MLWRYFFHGVVAVAVLLVPAQALAEYADEVLADNPVLYYQFEEAGSAVNSGSAGMEYDGFYMGGLALGTGPIGSSAVFDGTDDQIYISDTSSVLGGLDVTEMTFEAWVYVAVVPGLETLGRILQGQTAFMDVLYDRLGPDGAWRPSTYLFHDNGTYELGDFASMTTKVNVSLGEWHHLVLVGKEQEGHLDTFLYLDGNHVQSGHGKNDCSFISNGSELILGGDAFNEFMHNGNLDEVALYNVALSEERIQNHYRTGFGIPDMPGDTNNDGDVDAEDAAKLAANWLAYNPDFEATDGDFNGDGWVNEVDASILAANWTGSTDTRGLVPEPSTLVMLIALASGVVLLRRRRTRH